MTVNSEHQTLAPDSPGAGAAKTFKAESPKLLCTFLRE